MSKQNWKNILSASARILMAFVFVFGQTAWAGQNENPKAKSAASGKAQSQQSQATVASATPTRAQSVNEEESTPQSVASENSRGGQHEGIKVHGHWTIEVRNPDDSLVTHREFENSLVGGQMGGGTLLSMALSRQSTVGVWEVVLRSSTAPNAASNNLVIDEPLSLLIQFGPFCNAVCSQGANLIASGGGWAAPAGFSGATFTLAGSAVVPQGFGPSIGFVFTYNLPCSTNITPVPPACTALQNYFSNNLNIPLAVQNALIDFTGRTLDGLNGDPAAVPVSAGQTVAVTVNITFS